MRTVWARVRRVRVLSAVTLTLGMACVAVACGPARSASPAGPGPSPAPAVSPASTLAVKAPAGWRRVDLGHVRLSLPPGWTARGSGEQPNCEHVTAGFYHDVVFSGQPGGDLSCPGAADGVWLSLEPTTAPPPAAASHTKINGISAWVWPTAPAGTRRYDLVGDGEEITVHGVGAGRVLATLEPSALAAVLSTRYPIRVPGSWRRVRYDGVAVSVPATWPRRRLPSSTLPPGWCGLAAFGSGPLVYQGPPRGLPAAVHCPAAASGWAAHPADGVWVEPTPKGQGEAGAGQQQVRLRAGAGTATIVYSYDSFDNEADLVAVNIDRHGHHVTVTIGLGTDPVTAEEILSSLGIVGRPADHPARRGGPPPSSTLEYGKISLSVPYTWTVTEPALARAVCSGPTPSTTVAFGPPCATPHVGLVVSTEVTGPPPGDRRRRINGITVYQRQSGPTTIWDIPSLQARLAITGTAAAAVADTFQQGDLELLTTFGDQQVHVPRNWKTVTHDGVTVEVPPTWTPFRPSPTACDGPLRVPAGQPGKILAGTDPTATCTRPDWRLVLAPATGIWFQGHRPAWTGPGDLSQTLELNRHRLSIRWTPQRGPIAEIKVDTPHGTEWVAVGINSNWNILQTVLSTIRPASAHAR